jgi:phosphoglycolate phosphatase
MKLIIFDCDGTLVDSQRVIVAAMQRAFQSADLAVPSPAAVRYIVGLSLPEAIRRLCPEGTEAQIDGLCQHYRKHFDQVRHDPAMRVPLYEGCLDALARCEQAGYLLAVATGKSRPGLDAVLVEHGIAHRFVSLQTADRAAGKPHPEMVHNALAEAGGVAPENAVVVGDTVYDIEMARNGNVAAIGVDWGYHSPDALLSAGACEIAYEYATLPDLIGSVIGSPA